MRVLDASVVTDALAVTSRAGDQARELLAAENRLQVPAILAAEVTSALRALTRRGLLDSGAGRKAALQAASLRVRSYPFEPFVQRAWELRDNVTTYDAWYVALAETLGAPLVTADDRLRRATGPRCPVLSPEQALVEP